MCMESCLALLFLHSDAGELPALGVEVLDNVEMQSQESVAAMATRITEPLDIVIQASRGV